MRVYLLLNLGVIASVTSGCARNSVSHSQEASSSVLWRSTTWALRFSRDGQKLLSATNVFHSPLSSQGINFVYPTDGDNRLRIYDGVTGAPCVMVVASPIRGNHAVLLSDMKTMLTTWGAWDFKSVNIHSYRVEKIILINSGLIGSSVLSSDEKTFVVGMTRAVEIRDFPSQRVRHRFEHGGQGTSLNFGPHDKEILCWWSNEDEWKGVEAQCVDVSTGRQIRYPRWVYRVRGYNTWQFSPDAKLVALTKDGIVEVWTTPSQKDAGSKLRTFSTSFRAIHALAFSPDSGKLAVGGDSTTNSPVAIFDLKARPTS